VHDQTVEEHAQKYVIEDKVAMVDQEIEEIQKLLLEK